MLAAAGRRVAGRYRLAEPLSDEPGWSVWRAADEVLARPVTVSLLAPGSPRVGEVVAAARAAARLDDPRLARVFDVDADPEHSYVVTEWVPGTRLDDLVAASPLTPARAAAVIAEAAATLTGAHAAGLAHLCLTPESLWLAPSGEVKITGLGLAAALAGVRAGDGALADTRGLARLLYAALTGRWPGPEHTRLPAAWRDGGRLLRPAQAQAGIPPALDAVTWRALSGQDHADGPPILSPAQLATELAPFTPAGQCPDTGLAPTLPLPPAPALLPAVPPAVPAALTPGSPAGPAARAVPLLSGGPAMADAPTPAWPAVTRVPGKVGTPAARVVDRPRPATRPPGVARQAVRARMLRVMSLVLVLAVLTGGGWLLIRFGTAPGRTGAGHPPRTGPARALRPVSAAAFGPHGKAQGDNSQLAPLAIDASQATAWHTDWYTTAHFGSLQPGTGLLLDMGRTVTVTSAQITLGGLPGASLELRAGDTGTSLADLPPVVATATAGGQVRLRLTTPARGRYLLIWFTALPPDGSGTYQAAIYGIRLEGRP